MRNYNGNDLDAFPSAMGIVTRLACGRAKQEGVEVELLLRKAGLTHQQIDDPRARLAVKSQIRFLSSPQQHSRTNVSDFTLLRNSIFEWAGCFITYLHRLTRWVRHCSEECATPRSSTKVLH